VANAFIRRFKSPVRIDVFSGITPEACIRKALHKYRKKAIRLDIINIDILLYSIELEDNTIKQVLCHIIPYNSQRMKDYLESKKRRMYGENR